MRMGRRGFLPQYASAQWSKRRTLLTAESRWDRNDFFGQIVDTAGTVLLCLHSWGEHDHPSFDSPTRVEPGNGLLLFFRVDDLETSLANARKLVEQLDEEPNLNPSTGTREFSLRDPDGYYITISALNP